jgi:hypothetical protein
MHLFSFYSQVSDTGKVDKFLLDTVPVFAVNSEHESFHSGNTLHIKSTKMGKEGHCLQVLGWHLNPSVLFNIEGTSGISLLCLWFDVRPTFGYKLIFFGL